MTTVMDNSFLFFVYPFLFETGEFDERVRMFDGAQWKGHKRSANLWELQRFPEDDLLLHVARYLNPPSDVSPTARLWRLEENALNSPSYLGGGAEWSLTTPHGKVPFKLDGIYLSLFHIGVGFLTIRASPVTRELDDWQLFMHYFRFMRRPQEVRLHARRRVEFDTQSGEARYEDFSPAMVGAPSTRREEMTLGDIIDALLHTGEAAEARSSWWREVFVPGQLLPYTGLFLEGVTEAESPRLLYQIRNFFHPQQGHHPSIEDLRSDHPSLINYASQQYFIFSLNGVSFVAFNAPDTEFFRRTLPVHLQDQYFILFLLILHQRFALISLSQRVSEYWLRGDESLRVQAFEETRDLLLEFTARGYFAQVMQQEHHHRCYVRWQGASQVERLYQEVRHEVLDMHNYLQAKRTARLQRVAEQQQQELEAQNERIRDEARAEQARELVSQQRARRMEERISLLGLFIGVPVLIISFLNINLSGVTTMHDGMKLWQALSIVVAGSLVLISLIRLLLRKLL